MAEQALPVTFSSFSALTPIDFAENAPGASGAGNRDQALRPFVAGLR
jgi:hypothetical protein